jgi:hypothetical protein
MKKRPCYDFLCFLLLTPFSGRLWSRSLELRHLEYDETFLEKREGFRAPISICTGRSSVSGLGFAGPMSKHVVGR